MCDVMREIWFEFAGELYPRAAEAESFKLVRDRERCRRSSLFARQSVTGSAAAAHHLLVHVALRLHLDRQHASPFTISAMAHWPARARNR
jgi:hypothetical protein